MSKPRPIHIPPREIATIPDESEPVCSSYEDEDSFPDEPHIVTRRNFGGKASRRNSTGSGISWAKDGSSSFIPKEYKRSGTGKPSRRRSRSCSDIHQHGKWKTNGSTPVSEHRIKILLLRHLQIFPQFLSDLHLHSTKKASVVSSAGIPWIETQVRGVLQIENDRRN